MRTLVALAGAALVAAFAVPAPAQHIGDVSLSTVSQALAKSATCTGSSQSFSVQNLGQISHQATAVSAAASFVMEIDGGDSISTTYRISNPQVSFTISGTQSYVVQGYGFYAVEQVIVTCTSGATFSLSYSGGQTAFSNLIGPPGQTPVNPGNLSNVQGMVLPGTSTAGINPLLIGGLAPPVNQNLTAAGFDNLGIFTATNGPNFVGNVTEGSAPQLQQNGKEFAVTFEENSGNTNTQVQSVVAPWQKEDASFGNCTSSSGSPCVTFLNNVNSGQPYIRNYQSGGVQGQEVRFLGILTFTGLPTAAIRQGIAVTAASHAFSSNTLSGSRLAGAVFCQTSICTGFAATDTQGNNWQLVNTITAPTPASGGTLGIFVSSTLSSAAADTVTFTSASGSISAIAFVEITNLAPSNLTQPATFENVDGIGNSVTRLDAQAPNQFTCSVTLSTNTTTQLTGCGAPGSLGNNVPVRLYITDLQVETTTAGTATVVQVKTGTGSNCASNTANLSAITYSTATVGLQTVTGFRTPLVAPLQSAVCAAQSGTTAGTVVVEVHAFLAP
jgi:hypothetical protein